MIHQRGKKKKKKQNKNSVKKSPWNQNRQDFPVSEGLSEKKDSALKVKGRGAFGLGDRNSVFY